MKFLWTFIFLVFAFVSISAQSSLLESEDARFEAQMNKDTLSLSPMLSEDLLFIHSNAFEEDKADFLENVAKGKVIYKRMKAEPGREVISKGKTAITRGILQVAGTYDGGEFDIRVRYTAIYQKVKKRWLLLNWQSTKIVE